MVFKCCVPGCKNYQKDAQMHIFPKNQELYNVWIKRIGHPNLQEMPMEKVRKSYRVCNVHFGPDAQYIGLINKSTIKKDAIPSLFLPPTNLSTNAGEDFLRINMEIEESAEVDLPIENMEVEESIEVEGKLQNVTPLPSTSSAANVLSLNKRINLLAYTQVGRTSELTPKAKKLYRITSSLRKSAKRLNFKCLDLREKQSPKGYKLFKKLFAAPSRKTLTNMLRKISFNTGINPVIMESLSHKEKNSLFGVLIGGKEVVPLYDPPHLLKGVRNNFFKYNLKFKWRKPHYEVAKWDHIKKLFEIEGTEDDDYKLYNYTDEIPIQRGVRQGFILLPTLFNVYSDQLFKKALKRQPYGIKINGELLNVIRYADDTVEEKIGIEINSNKIKFLVFSRDPNIDAKLQLNGIQVEKVHKMTYLRTVITDQLDPDRNKT
ncbi:unnamed protein product [Diabrotica balteata]|uniref:THAP-type domain-containing protein n=1 Tax=Diabrotica balteata TaxID=107213 RepID=A0A9N9XCI6_DIABA|nr:unnamed protein product [Diabrotica balteata]